MSSAPRQVCTGMTFTATLDGLWIDDGFVFRVRPAKVLAFSKSPHGQTRFVQK